MFFVSLNSFSQNYIGTKTSSTPGDICHTGGNLGIGTTTPETLLHLTVDHNSSTDFPTIRLENTFPKSINENIWDIKNAENLIFSFGGDLAFPTTKMILSPDGQIVLGTQTINNSAILQLESTSMGILIPRMTNTQISNITAPAKGLLAYSIDDKKFRYYDGTSENWQTLVTSSQLNNQLSNYLLISDFNNTISNYVTNDNLNDTLSYYSLTSDIASTYLTSNYFNAEIANYVTNAALADSGFITASSTNELTNKSGDISMWTNDAGYITNADIPTQIWQQNITGIDYSEGNVGIGTNKPLKQLHISAQNSNSTIRLTNQVAAKITIPPVPVTNYNWDIVNDNSRIVFSYAGSGQAQHVKASLNSDGTLSVDEIYAVDATFTDYVKIGDASTSDNALLNIYSMDGMVNGIFVKAGYSGANTTLLNLESADNVKAMHVTGNGKVGIGTDYIPNDYKLAVNGNIMADNATLSGTINAQEYLIDGSPISSLGIWQQNGDDIYYNNGSVRIGNHPNGYSSYNQKLQVIAEGDITAGMWTTKAHPFAIIGSQDILVFGTDQETECAYLQAYEFSSNKSDSIKTQKSINLVLNNNGGNVGVGTTSPLAKFSVNNQFLVNKNGNVYARKLTVTQNDIPDYVFQTQYYLKPLDSVENFIKINKHLPDIPNQNEIKDKGMDVGEFNSLLLLKIEELTLYIIEQNKKINDLQNQVLNLSSEK